MWSLNLHFKCNTLHLNQMCHKSVPSHYGQHGHVLVHLNSLLPPFVDGCAGNSAFETVITPEEEDHR